MTTVRCSTRHRPAPDGAVGGRTGQLDAAAVLERLWRDRSLGGYGGVISFVDFSELTRGLRWGAAETEDCWTDILQGDTTHPTVTDLPRVVTWLARYSARHAHTLSGDEHACVTDARASTCATTHRVKDAETAQHIDMTEARATKATTADAMSTSTAAVCRGRSDRARYARHTAASRNRGNARRAVTPPTAPVSRGSSWVHQRVARVPSPRPGGEGHEVVCAKDDPGSTRHRTGSRQTTRRDTAPVRLTGDEVPHTQRYRAPTRSYCYRVACSEGRARDGVDGAPVTPRVDFHPAPGPAKSVPAGYVEAVARMRRSRGASSRASFIESLRATSAGAQLGGQNGNTVYEGPVLRFAMRQRPPERHTLVDLCISAAGAT